MFCQQAEELDGVLLARSLLLDALHHELLGVDALVAGMANVQVADRPFQAFNFDAAYCSILSVTQTMSATGRQNVIGTFLIPNTHETDVSVQVSADGWYAELSLRAPPMFLYLVDCFAK